VFESTVLVVSVSWLSLKMPPPPPSASPPPVEWLPLILEPVIVS